VDICKTCGRERGAHHYQTWQCPDHALEKSPSGRGFLSTTFSGADERIDGLADRLNEVWPHLFNDGFQRQVAAEAVSYLDQGARDRRDERVAEVQAALVSALNTLGEAVLGGTWERLTSLPLADSEVAEALAKAGIG
jgi:hypothetical protein